MRCSAVLALALLALPGSAVAAKPPSKPKHSQQHQTRGTKTRTELQGAILARPNDSDPDPTGTHKWNGAEAKPPYCTAHFCVHWTEAAPDTSNANYAQQLGDILEKEVYACENTTDPSACAGGPGLGWRDPPPDFGLGGDNRVDVYIEDLYSTEGLFGYVARDPGQVNDPSVPHFSYMVMDNDYSRYGTAGGALGAEHVTA